MAEKDTLNKDVANYSEEKTSFINNPSFSDCSEKTQQQLIDAQTKLEKMKVGFVGRLFGTDPSCSSKNIAFVVCFLLILVFILDFIFEVLVGKKPINEKITNSIFPVLTLFLGYLFGK